MCLSAQLTTVDRALAFFYALGSVSGVLLKTFACRLPCRLERVSGCCSRPDVLQNELLFMVFVWVLSRMSWAVPVLRGVCAVARGASRSARRFRPRRRRCVSDPSHTYRSSA